MINNGCRTMSNAGDFNRSSAVARSCASTASVSTQIYGAIVATD